MLTNGPPIGNKNIKPFSGLFTDTVCFLSPSTPWISSSRLGPSWGIPIPPPRARPDPKDSCLSSSDVATHPIRLLKPRPRLSIPVAGGMDSGANSVGESVGESPVPAPAPQTRPAEPVTKGRGLRRWRRIPREQHHEGSPVSPGLGNSAGASAGEDLAAQLHKRRYGPADDKPKGKQDAAAEEVESSVASVKSSFVPLEVSPPPPPTLTRLDPNLGHLIATTGFSVGAGGADSDNSDDRTSKSSTAPPPRLKQTILAPASSPTSEALTLLMRGDLLPTSQATVFTRFYSLMVNKVTTNLQVLACGMLQEVSARRMGV
uniref:Uncharacterized protein n=1 Tax=Zea mays TaxID=4577 RepID=A0A804Q9U3_MAIZE